MVDQKIALDNCTEAVSYTHLDFRNFREAGENAVAVQIAEAAVHLVFGEEGRIDGAAVYTQLRELADFGSDLRKIDFR